ncbi:MAG TPA: ferric enterobactin receptor [Cytophagales bacterium]|nr:ferric enterobactin receptor [Cytophagales bacterium]
MIVFTKSRLFPLSLIFLALLQFPLLAQPTGTVKGKIRDADTGEELIGATVRVMGTSEGAVTNVAGDYTLQVPSGSVRLEASFVGYAAVERTIDVAAGATVVQDFELSFGSIDLNEIVVVGSRNENRSVLETPVPVDVIPLQEITQGAPQIELGQILNYVAPSFSSNRQTISDGTDHVDPASLRGLGVDHVLVLINGKRRHASSLVNVNGTFGRGSVGTDLNSIPAAAIERIEVLRDGAAAQYGSDAIAGVINIVLKESTDQLTGTAMAGQTYLGDGENLQYNANYGFEVGQGGFVNVTGQYQYRGRTDRAREYTGSVFRTNGSGIYREDFAAGDFSPFVPGSRLTANEAAVINAANSVTNNMTEAEEEALIEQNGGRRAFTMMVGNSESINTALMVNAGLPLNQRQEFYAFGGLNSRQGMATGFYRLPNQTRTLTTIYPNGFLPEINTSIFDASLAAGIRGEVGDGWNFDISNTWGTNRFQFVITNTHNASMGTASPTSFDAGGFQFQQNTTNLDLSKYYDLVLSGLNLAFGAEYRQENYQLFAGEEGSYRNFGVVNLVDSTADGGVFLSGNTSNIFYDRPGGSQVFPGFQPANVVNRSRSTAAVYVDVEINFTENFFIDVAGRYENYTDFGSTLNGKIATRLAVTDALAFRAAASTGFRAPSLAQRYFNNTSTIFTLQNGVSVANEVGTFRNDSRVAKLLGIPGLTNESSVNYSAGMTYQLAKGLDITVDGYLVDVTNRVVLTGQFNAGSSDEIAAILTSVNAGRAQLFTNAIDTRTVGLDAIVSYQTGGDWGRFSGTLAANFNNTEVTNINIPEVLQADPGTFFNREEQGRFESAVPRNKANLALTYSKDKWSVNVTNVRFGEVTARLGTEADPIDQTFSGKIITDASIGYQLTENSRITIGGNNLFNVYPDENREEYRSSERFVYSRRVSQFGFNGGFYFARLSLSI